MKALKDFVKSSKDIFGSDIDVSIARAPMFGNNDACFLVYGKNGKKVVSALALFMKSFKTRVETTTSFMGSKTRTYFVLEGQFK